MFSLFICSISIVYMHVRASVQKLQTLNILWGSLPIYCFKNLNNVQEYLGKIILKSYNLRPQQNKQKIRFTHSLSEGLQISNSSDVETVDLNKIS